MLSWCGISIRNGTFSRKFSDTIAVRTKDLHTLSFEAHTHSETVRLSRMKYLQGFPGKCQYV